jgi:hypothetical protein
MVLSEHICRHWGKPPSSIITVSAWALCHVLTGDTYVSSASTKSSLYLQCSATLYTVRPIDYLGICISRQQTAGGLWPIAKIIFNGCSRAYKVHVNNALPLNGSPVFVQASRNSKTQTDLRQYDSRLSAFWLLHNHYSPRHFLRILYLYPSA